MGKRIRHLEFYGYADQNVYMGIPNVDLSDIRETNKEQDKEINAISGATSGKADKSTVDSLSGKVDTFMDKQDMINKWLAKGINKNRERIDGLERRDEEITTKINEIVDDFNPIYDELGNLSTKVDSVDSRLNQHISQESTFEEETNERLNALESNIDEKIDKTEAYDVFAKKSDVYTKTEIEEKFDDLSGEYPTKEWVRNQGYITENEADSKYATKTRVNALDARVTDVQTTLTSQYTQLNSDYTRFKDNTNNAIDDIDSRLDTLEVKHTSDIENLTNTTDALQRQVNQNIESIRLINDVSLPNKANKSDVDTLTSKVDTLSNNLNSKVDKADYARDMNILDSDLQHIRDTKADKSQLDIVSGNVNTVNDRLSQEIQDRINGDNALDARVNATNTRIDDIREENLTRDSRLTELENGLRQEINDRADGDDALRGTPQDKDIDITIYGSRKYADKVAQQALAQSKTYADAVAVDLKDYVDNQDYALEQKISAKADASYVNQLRNEIEASTDRKISAEETRATNVENSITRAINDEVNRALRTENQLSKDIAHTSNIVKALTEWDGDDRRDYEDTGNGVVDVMHRELHDIEEAISAITVIGEGIQTSNPHEVGFGTYNVTHTGADDSEKTSFTIGNGTSDLDRKNAIEIRKNGDIYMWIEGDFMKVNDLLAMLAHEIY